MKALSSLLTIALLMISGNSLFAVHTEKLSKAEMENLTVNQFLDIKYKTYKKLLPHKPKLKDRLNHFMLKKYVDIQVNSGSLDGEENLSSVAAGFSFKFGAFLLGLLLGIVGLLIVALLFNKTRKNAIISCLIGMVVWAVIVGAIY